MTTIFGHGEKKRNKIKLLILLSMDGHISQIILHISDFFIKRRSVLCFTPAIGRFSVQNTEMGWKDRVQEWRI